MTDNDAREAASSSSDEGSPPYYDGPQELLSAAATDPFESLAFDLDTYSWRLLNFWLDARGSSAVREDFRSQLSFLRKADCFPMFIDSPAAFSAASMYYVPRVCFILIWMSSHFDRDFSPPWNGDRHLENWFVLPKGLEQPQQGPVQER